MSDVEIDIPLEADELRDLPSRLTAVAIALITLFAAGFGFLQAGAVRQSGDAEVQAQRLGVQAFGQLVDAESQAQQELGAFATSVEDSAMHWDLLLRAHMDHAANEAALMADAETWAGLATISAGRTTIPTEPRSTPEGDLAFPQRFLTERSRDGYVLTGRQDALVEYAGAWGARAGAYAAILAVLAVGVYLLGLSLTVNGRRAKRTFIAIGAVMALGGLGWGLNNWLTSPVLAPDAAAEHFADGRVKLLTAATQQDYEAAAAEFSEAISLRPTFALAYQNRATAIFEAGSPQLGGYTSVATVDAARAGRDDLRRARSLGIETRSVIGNLGFYCYLIGLQTDSKADLEEGIRLTREAIELDESDAVTGTDLVFIGNLAVALLATGQDSEAAGQYDAFIAGLSAEDPVTHKRLDVGTATYIAAGAMSDLQVLLSKQPDLASTVDALKARMAGAVAQAPADLTPSGTVQKTGAETVFPGELQFEVKYEGLANTDYLSVYWYRDAPDGSGWHVLPEVSGPLWYLDPEDEPEIRGGQTSTYVYLAPLIEKSSPRRCVEPGDYRGELYLNDQLVDVVEGTADWDRLQPFLFRELGVAMCGPTDWVRLADREVGHSDGFVSPDRSHGAIVMRLPATGQSLADSIAHAVERKGIPRELEKAEAYTDYFLGLRTHLIQEYTYDGGKLRALAGFVPGENVHLVAMIFGPDSWWDEDESVNLVDSLRTYDVAPAGDAPSMDPGPGNPSFGTVSFSSGAGSDGRPIDDLAAAPGTSTQLCAFWTYESMGAAATWAAKWYIGGVEVTDYGTTETKWTGGANGTWYTCIGDGAERLPTGEYEFQLTLQGEIERSNDLFVGGSHPSVDFEIENRSGVDICSVWLSLPSSGRWGTDDLADPGTVADGTSATLTVPSGTYDILVEGCDDKTLVEKYDVRIDSSSAPFVVKAPG